MSVQFGVLSRRLPMDYGRKPHNEPMRFDVRMGSIAPKMGFPPMSGLPPIATELRTSLEVRFVPCVDGSELARTFFTYAALVGAAMCSACRCGSHDRWP